MPGRDLDEIRSESIEAGEGRLRRSELLTESFLVCEIAFGVLAGTAGEATWTHLAQNFRVAVAGSLVGGPRFVAPARILQIRGERDNGPDEETAAPLPQEVRVHAPAMTDG